jgi:hypothetical protein
MILMDFPYQNNANPERNMTPGEQWAQMPSNEMDLFCFAQATAMAAMPFFNTFQPNPQGKNDLNAVTRNILELARSAISALLTNPAERRTEAASALIRVEAFRPDPAEGGRIELNVGLDLGCANWWDVADMLDPAPKP